MKKKSLWKNIYREILRSSGRYLAILGIILLGSGFFIGLRSARGAMVRTVNTYLDRTRFFDFSLSSTLGYSEEEAAGFTDAAFVEAAEGAYRCDALVSVSADEDAALAFLSLPEDINLPELKEGRFPENRDECIVDASLYNLNTGDTVSLSDHNDEETLEDFAHRSFTVVGKTESPLYLNYERGTTSLGTGTLLGFVYIPYESFDVDYYSTVYIRLTDMPAAYSDEYETRADEHEPQVKELAETLAHDRYLTLYKEAEQEIADGEKEYEDGVKEYRQERADAEQELADAKQELEDAKKELADARRELDNAVGEIASGRAELEQEKLEALAEIADAENKLADARKKIDDGEYAYSKGWNEYHMAESDYDPLSGDMFTRYQLDTAKYQLELARKELDEGRAEYANGLKELEDAKAEFVRSVAEAEAELADAERKRINGEAEYADGMKEYEEGLAEYEDAEKEAQEEFAKAEKELADAAQELEDVREELADFTGPDVYVLGRFSNIGYACYDNDSAIVQSIATVFPIFFFLVAALICMTTIGRMVDEQRGQLGVMNALGYSAHDTMLKYMVYAGSATAIGAVAGVLIGSFVIPQVLWKAYSIMYTYTESLEYYIDLPLSAVTVLAYIVAMLLVTWYSVRSTLREMPAQILRPKPPKAGKRVLLEHITPLWSRLGFMWKVTMRNIFRYRERVLMMVLGVAGCTALMITGFGIRDSIQNIVDYQYDEITLYDYDVLFNEAMSEADMEDFRASLNGRARDVLFAHQESVTARNGRNEKTVYLTVIPEPEHVDAFISLKADGVPLPWPGEGEVLINNGLARALGLSAGDTITVRTDAHVHTFTVSGVFDNYIYNYIYMDAATYRSAEKTQPEIKTAYVCAGQEGDDLTGLLLQDENVLNVTAGSLLRERIGSIMDNLIYIVILTIVCAAALAFIVIYNLTNININERVREIATVKVLGFYAGETAGYVLRENVILTLLGALLGIPLGIALNAYVMNMIRVDLVYFTPRILPVSFLYGVVLTILFGTAVDFVMAVKLNRINEALALKAAE
ncbi:MAG: ABC transporter permease [Butyrivibrio sp.]|nr:ABC transporter permease [Butyrivibrio sp.]